jgi:hypothetical protein
MAAGDSFITTGEILLPRVKWNSTEAGKLSVDADVNWTFPLRMSEIVWGEGTRTERKIIELDSSREFGNSKFHWSTEAPGWKWARLAVWDVAGDGAFTQPIWTTGR